MVKISICMIPYGPILNHNGDTTIVKSTKGLSKTNYKSIINKVGVHKYG